MADKKLNEVTKVTDMAYVPVILSDGSVGQIAKADLATVVAGICLTKGWRTLSSLSEQMSASVAAIESAFKSNANYSLFSHGTTSGAEAGVYMFKHTTALVSYGVLFSKALLPSIVRRTADGAWQYKEILAS